MRQVHAAIEHHDKQNYECAITLAAAGEGMLPKPEKEYFRRKIQEMSKALPSEIDASTGPNDVIHWLKHGTVNGKKVDGARP